MRIAFDQMPDHARLWVYQANRPLTASEEADIRLRLDSAFDDWAAHGQPLTNAVEILAHRVVLLAVDEQAYAASGCSIDASTRIIREAGTAHGIDFFDRSVLFETADGISAVDALKAKAAVLDGRISPETSIYNAQVKTVGEYRSSWLVPAAESWLKRFFTPVA
ncbi:MAG: hypothetical protein J7576_08955 [Siphonobacter aquaeclarae]|nr:hypothetical protein [Siphonobacter aquaeclarae]